MEIFNTDKFYILWNGFTSLWCEKRSGKFEIKNNINPPDESDMECMGIVYGIIGKIQPIKNIRYGALIVIAEQTNLGDLYQHKSIFLIDRIAILPFSNDVITDFGSGTVSNNSESTNNVFHLMPCIKHKIHNEIEPKSSVPGTAQSSIKKILPISLSPPAPLQKTWTSLKAVAESALPKQTNYILNLLDADDNDEDKLTNKVYNEIDKLFNSTESFYYSRHFDLTNSVQRNSSSHSSKDGGNLNTASSSRKDPFDITIDCLDYDWDLCDERFFWNFQISKEIRNVQAPKDVLAQWVLPVIQGCVRMNKFEPNDFTNWTSGSHQKVESDLYNAATSNKPAGPIKSGEITLMGAFTKLTRTKPNWLASIATAPQPFAVLGDLCFTLISRRNRHRTGTRYNKRGIDADGNVANYVETEQVVAIANHIVSFVMVRASIPLFWSQGGMKYRPTPTLEKSEEETFSAFSRHFDRELRKYHHVTIVNLSEQSGREKSLSDAYLLNVLKYDQPQMTYVTFDFHEYCQGMRYENVSVLTESVADVIKHMQYCWLDSKGFICQQQGVFRINCIDCLDRTNMVEMALAKIILEIQLRKMGLLAPETEFPPTLLRAFHFAWAHNGDALSLQYAGTAALKGDFTRTGQKKLTSLFKDGYNSATRYYMNQFRDAYRQLAYDVLQGQPLSRESLEKLIPQHQQLATYLLSSSQPLASFFKNMSLPTNSFPNPLDLSTEIGAEASGESIIDPIIDYCERAVLTESELRYGSWKLRLLPRDLSENQGAKPDGIQNGHCVLILTQQAYYVVGFSGEAASFVVKDIKRIPLTDLYCLEYGPAGEGTPDFGQNLLLLWHSYDNVRGYFNAFRDPTANPHELKLVFQCFKAVIELVDLSKTVAVKEGPIFKLDYSKIPSHAQPRRQSSSSRVEGLLSGGPQNMGLMLRRATRDAISALAAIGPEVNRLTKTHDDTTLWNKPKKSLTSRFNVRTPNKPEKRPNTATASNASSALSFPDDWREVLCPGIDEDLKISLTKDGNNTANKKTGSTTEHRLNLNLPSMPNGFPQQQVTPPDTSDSTSTAGDDHQLMKLKLKCRSRILEL